MAHREPVGPFAARVALQMSAASPMLALWALTAAASGDVGAAALFLGWAVVPALLILLRLRIASNVGDSSLLTIGRVDGAQGARAIYVLLLTLLSPIVSIGRTGPVLLLMAALCAGVVTVAANGIGLGHGEVLFALAGRRVVTAWAPEDDNPFTSRDPFWVVSDSADLVGDVVAWRITSELFVPHQRLASRPRSAGKTAVL